MRVRLPRQLVCVLSCDTYLYRCQIAAWKEHKTSCRGKKLSLDAIRRKVGEARAIGNWDEILRWESRIDELVSGQHHETIVPVLYAFANAYHTTSPGKAALMFGRAADSWGALSMFMEQVEAMGDAATFSVGAGDYKQAAVWFERARDVSVERGFAVMEVRLRYELNEIFQHLARDVEAVEQLQRALVVVDRVLKDAPHARYTGWSSQWRQDPSFLQKAVLRALVCGLTTMGRVEEAESVFIRLGEGGNNTPDCTLWNFKLRGSIHVCRGNHGKAAEAFQAAVEVAAKHPEVLRDRHAESALREAKTNLSLGRAKDGPPLRAIIQMVERARGAEDSAGVLRWESRLGDMLSTQAEAVHPALLQAFAEANFHLRRFSEAARLHEMRAHLFGKMERFRDQGWEMFTIGQCFVHLKNPELAATWFRRVRQLGEKHGFFDAE